MKQLLLTWIILLGVVGLGFTQTQKTLVKTLATQEGYEEVIFNIQGQTEVQEWENNTIRIITKITTLNAEEQILKALVVAGRYEYTITKNQDAGTLTIDMQKKEQVIIINGINLEEQLEYKIFIPKGMNYQIQPNNQGPMM